jgi:phosphoribosylamine--glycine ligase
MGAYSPAPVMTPEMCEITLKTIVEPLVRAMAADGAPFKGVFYAGLMIADGVPKLLEVNVRFGDPECQAILPRLKSDLFTALQATRDGRLNETRLEWHNQVALCVVLASKGYPGAYKKGSIINGLEKAEAEGATIFHAGTSIADCNITATGGRVLGVTALGPDIAEAQAKAYRAVDQIDWPGGFCRRDIGWRAVGR